LIPLTDNIPTRRRPLVTLALIAINVAVFLFQMAAPVQQLPTTNQRVYPVEGQTAIQYEYGFVPCELLSSCQHGDDTVDVGGRANVIVHHVPVLLTMVTSMFLHGGWAHLGFNMLFLWIFGSSVEDRLGRPRFAAFYLLGGVAALGLQWAVDRSSDIPTIGASGAIAAVLAGYLVLFPRAVIVTLVGWIPVPLPAMLFLVVWIGLQVLGATAGFSQAGGGSEGGVAYFAHVGGFVFGLAAVRSFDRGP
jgi:rhomboid family protein